MSHASRVCLNFCLAMLLMVWSLVAAHARDLLIAMPNWPSGQGTANVLKIAIKKEFGLDAEVREMGTLLAFAGLNSSEVDIHPEVWLPNLDNLVEKYVKKAGTVQLSPIGVPAWQGICANRVAADRYGIKQITDLNDPKRTATLDTDNDGKGEMWIGTETWSSTPIERIRANSYGYAKNLTLLVGPEDVGMAAVDAAEATGRPIVFACYAPHYVFELHDIVKLKEPPYDPAKWKILLPTEDPLWLSKSRADVGWDSAHYHIAYATSLKKGHPDVAAFLDRVEFKPEDGVEMSYAIQVERKDPYKVAEEWVAKNSDRVDGWAKP